MLEQHHNDINGSYNLFQFGLFLRETFEKTLMHYKKAMTSFSLAANDLERIRCKHINQTMHLFSQLFRLLEFSPISIRHT